MNTHLTAQFELSGLNMNSPPAGPIPARAGARHEHVPDLNSDYVVPRTTLSDFVLWWSYSEPKEGFWLFGPTGSGKSEFIRAMASHLNIPLYEATGFWDLDVQDLITQRSLAGGNTVTIRGPLAKAMAEGGWFMMNELDRCNPESLVALNEFGSKITLLDSGGKLLEPHADFRFIVTANSGGMEDRNGHYGAKMMDLSFTDRFTFSRMLYPDDATTARILKQAVPNLTDQITPYLITIANEVRAAFYPLDEGGNEQTSRIRITVSTRNLIRWARYLTWAYQVNEIENPVTHAFDRAIGLKAPAQCRAAVHSFIQRVFGDDQKNPKPLVS